MLGPLQSGNTVVVIGGGPGGASCAIALKNLAKMDRKQLRVILYEGKIFERGTHHNQCAGVLSPPIVEILETDLQVKFPWDLVQKEITGYILHSTNEKIHLSEESDPTYAVRRVTFDDYLLNQARERGVEVIQSRVTDVEIFSDRIMVYSESENKSADVIVGAFGLDDGTAKIFERATQYRQPRFLSSIVTKIHPGKEFMNIMGIFAGGILLLTPGFITDFLGLLLFMPFFRLAVGGFITLRMEKQLQEVYEYLRLYEL